MTYLELCANTFVHDNIDVVLQQNTYTLVKFDYKPKMFGELEYQFMFYNHLTKCINDYTKNQDVAWNKAIYRKLNSGMLYTALDHLYVKKYKIENVSESDLEDIIISNTVCLNHVKMCYERIKMLKLVENV
jgi:hypothetical protein